MNCRCAMAPHVKGSKLHVTPGAERFAALPEEAQRQVLGPSAYEAYRDGALQLGDLVGRTQSARWGDSMRVRSLRSVVGAERAEQYAARGQVRTVVLAALAHLPETPKALAQVDRLVETRMMSQVAAQGLIERIQQGGPLPKLEQHFGRHGEDFKRFGVEDAQGFEEYLQRHLGRSDLRMFTYVTTNPTHDRMWIAVGMDNGVVAQYNETKQKLWSLFWQKDVVKYLASGNRWWVEVVSGAEEVRFEPW